MKPLGIIFILIAIGCALNGHTSTTDTATPFWTSSYLALQKEQAEERIKMAQETMAGIKYLASGNSSFLAQIGDANFKNDLIKSISTRGTDISDLEVEYSQTTRNLTKHKEALRDAEAKIAEKRQWTYIPAAILTVIGLILLVVPTTPKRDPFLPAPIQ